MMTKTGTTELYATRHGLRPETRKSMVALLNERLADGLDLYAQTKHAHWNVKGIEFQQLHLLFDELAEIVEGHADLLAERATALGGVAHGTLRMAANASTLQEFPTIPAEGRAFVDAMAERYAMHAKLVGEAINRADDAGDRATADVFTEIVRDLDKALYFLESHLQGPRGS